MPSISTLKSALLLYMLSLGRAAAHEHHDDKIPEGHAISPDPLVRLPASDSTSSLLMQCTGQDTMDTYPRTDNCLRTDIPHGHGSRGKSSTSKS